MRSTTSFYAFMPSIKLLTVISMRFLSNFCLKNLMNIRVKLFLNIFNVGAQGLKFLLTATALVLTHQAIAQTGPAASPSPATTAAAVAPRVVSLSGALTEIVYALNAQSQLVAVDTTSVYPPATNALPKVGYMRQLSAEGVLAMRPTLVLATSEAGPPNVITQIKNAGVQVIVVSSDHSFEELRNKVRSVAAALGLLTQGKALEEQLSREMTAVQSQIQSQAAKAKPRVLFVLSHNGTPSVSGQGTAADAFIKLAGASNAVQGFEGYKPMTAEALLNAAPEVILTTQQGIDAIGGIDRLFERPGMSLTPAGKKRRIVVMDALYMLGFGPRLAQAVREAWLKFSGTP